MFTDNEPLVDSHTASAIRSYVERVEQKHAVRDEIATEIADIYAEAKSHGIDVKALKAIVQLRRKDPRQMQYEQTLIDAYLRAVGVNAGSARTSPDEFLNDEDDGFPSDEEEGRRPPD